MRKQIEQVVKIWPCSQAPSSLKRLSGKKAEWVVLIPASLVTSEVEALFLRWNTGSYPVIRRTLADGSIVFSGNSELPLTE
jgi:hypothetical protein